MIRRHASSGGWRSLQRRFMVIVILGALLFSLAAGGISFLLAERRTLASSRHAIENLTTAVEKTLAVGAFANDAVLLDEVVRGLAGHELVRSAEVRVNDGKLLAASGDTGDEPAAPGSLVERKLMSPFDASESVGTVVLRVDMHRVAQLAVEEALLLGGLMVGQGALVALLLYAVVAALVSGPIVRLAHALPEMVPGSDRRLDKPAYHGDDEIGLLVDATNALLDAHGHALQRERELSSEVQAMEAQYRQIFDSSSAGIFVLDGRGCLINSNPTVSRVAGLTRTQLVGLQHESFVRRVFTRPEKVQRMIEEAGRSGRTVSGDLQLRLDHDISCWVHCLISVQAGGDALNHTVEGVIYDVTERKSSELRVRHRAEHDALTGLKNRAATQAAVERMIDVALASGRPATLLCVDLDGFKRINDDFGHSAGDQVLTVCAKRMGSSVRAEVDIVGRVGGDEFIIALGGIGPDDPTQQQTVAALLAGLCRPIALDDSQRVTIGASIGIACVPHHGSDYATLVEAADQAMYEVKRSGKNSFAMASTRAAAAPEPIPGAVFAKRPAFELTDF